MLLSKSIFDKCCYRKLNFTNYKLFAFLLTFAFAETDETHSNKSTFIDISIPLSDINPHFY